MRLLFVCTGNLCRSPVAEQLVRAWAREAFGDAGAAVDVRSAGLAATQGRPMHPHSAAALISLGGDPAGFLSRPFEAAMATDADLVLTMTRKQRHSVLERTPRGLRRTFTLLEAAALLPLAELSGIDALPPEERAAGLAVRLDVARRYRGSTSADDIADPVAGRAAAHREAAQTIAGALRPLADVLLRRDPAALPAEGMPVPA